MYFTSVREFEEKTGLDLEDMVGEEVNAGKYDCTDYHGYLQNPLTGLYWAVSYSCSYNNGVDYIDIDMTRQYLQEERTIVETFYKLA